MPASLIRRLALSAALVAGGCGPGTTLHPVRGSVTYKGKPLAFGIVMFQPPAGGPATGQIRPDGSFELEIPGVGRGAPAGTYQILVLCHEGHDPQRAAAGEGEPSLGRALIPARYGRYETSGLSRTVPDETAAGVVLALKD